MTKTQATKAQRLAKQHQTQIWILLSPREARELAAGIVPLTVQRQLQRLGDTKGKPA